MHVGQGVGMYGKPKDSWLNQEKATSSQKEIYLRGKQTVFRSFVCPFPRCLRVHYGQIHAETREW